MLNLNEIHHGDCLALMRHIPDGSVDCILSDPPYHITALHYDREPMVDWAAWWQQAWRVLKPSGVVVLFAADLFTVDLILTQRANYRYRLVWEKSRATGYLRANRQPLKAHEDVLIFGRNGNSSIYNPQKSPPRGAVRQRRRTPAKANAHYTTTRRKDTVEDGSRHPVSVLRFASEHNANTVHPNQKPEDLIRWLVRTYTNPGQIVLDTFAGSATTAVACLREGRDFLCCERDGGYFAKAQARLVALSPQLTLVN